jgi:uncharacterized protein (DUF58 family)
VRQLGNWGLAWNDWKIPASEKVAVYPDLVMLKELSIRLTLENSGTMRGLRKLGMGTEFAELREYGIGDDPRLIDWKATARIAPFNQSFRTRKRANFDYFTRQGTADDGASAGFEAF